MRPDDARCERSVSLCNALHDKTDVLVECFFMLQDELEEWAHGAFFGWCPARGFLLLGAKERSPALAMAGGVVVVEGRAGAAHVKGESTLQHVRGVLRTRTCRAQ